MCVGSEVMMAVHMCMQVARGDTRHAEVVRVTFDSRTVSFSQVCACARACAAVHMCALLQENLASALQTRGAVAHQSYHRCLMQAHVNMTCRRMRYIVVHQLCSVLILRCCACTFCRYWTSSLQPMTHARQGVTSDRSTAPSFCVTILSRRQLQCRRSAI